MRSIFNCLNQTHLFLWVKQQESICNPSPTFGPVTINIPVSNVVHKPSENIPTVLPACLISTFIFTVLSCTLVYKYRLDIPALIYVKTGRKFFGTRFDDDDKRKYDAFFSFSSLDRDFVLDGIENCRKLCIHHPDFMVGEFIATNIVNAIEKSKRIIILCSNNYLKSEWCSYEFRVSHRQALKDRRHRIILIMMEDVDDKNLDIDSFQ